MTDGSGAPDEVQRKAKGSDGDGVESPTPKEGAKAKRNRRVLYLSELHQIPKPEPLVGSKLAKHSLVVLASPPSKGKSFLALDWALSVATGMAWNGEPVEKGSVLYIVGEGGGAMEDRVEAWMQANAWFEEPDVAFLPKAVDLLPSAGVNEIIEAVADMRSPPVLIVVDTLARCTVGAEENSAKDMGLFIANLDRIREQTGATILVLHHTTKSGESERGSSALAGAADQLMHIRNGKLVSVKQKDQREFRALGLKLVPVGNSAVMTYQECKPEPDGDGSALLKEPTRAEIALRVLQERYPNGAASSDWMMETGMARSTFFRTLNDLSSKGWVVKDDRSGMYAITEVGRQVLGAVSNGDGGSEPDSDDPELDRAA